MDKSKWLRYIEEHAEVAAAWKRRIARREAQAATREAKKASERKVREELSPEAWIRRVLARGETVDFVPAPPRDKPPMRIVVAVAPVVRRLDKLGRFRETVDSQALRFCKPLDLSGGPVRIGPKRARSPIGTGVPVERQGWKRTRTLPNRMVKR
jgi:hypothetical protein